MTRTCLKCGTVAFAVTRQHAEDEVARFNAYFKTLTPEDQGLFGGTKANIQLYERCGCGNPWTNFRRAKVGDCPDGCTLSPIIWESSK